MGDYTPSSSVIWDDFCVSRLIIPRHGRSRRQLLYDLLRLWYPYCVVLRFREPDHYRLHPHSLGHDLGHVDPLLAWEQLSSLETCRIDLLLLDILIDLEILEPSPTCFEVILDIPTNYFDSRSPYTLLPPEHVQWFIDSWLLLCDSLQARAAWFPSSLFASFLNPERAERTFAQWRSAVLALEGSVLLEGLQGCVCWLLYLGPDLLQQPATRQALSSCEASLAAELHQFSLPADSIVFGPTPAGGWFARYGLTLDGPFVDSPDLGPRLPAPQGGRGFALLAPSDSSPDQLWPQRARSLLFALLHSLHQRGSLLACCIPTARSLFLHLGQTIPLDKSFRYYPVHSLPWEAILQLPESLDPLHACWQLQFADVPGLLALYLTSFGDVTLDLQWEPEPLARLSPEQETAFALAWASLWLQQQAPYAFLVRLGFHDEACSWVRFAFRHLPLLRQPSPASLDPLLQESSRFHWLTFLGSPLLLALDPPQWQALLLRLCQQDARLFLLLPQQPPLALPEPAAAPPAPLPGSGLLLLRPRFAPGFDPDAFLSFWHHLQQQARHSWWRDSPAAKSKKE
jgi:hypothetical protein